MIAEATIATDSVSEWHSPAMRNDVRLISGRHVLAKFVNRKGIGTPYLTGPSDFPDGRILKQKFTTQPDAMCQPGDILVTVKGSGAGKIAVADDHYCISRQLMAVRVERWNADYLFYALSHTAGVLQEASTGLIPGLSRSDILGQMIGMPSCPDEQRAIAAALSDADALIAALERLIAKKRDIKQGAMQELLTGKRRLPGFEGAWETRPLSDLADLSRRSVVPRSQPSQTYAHYSIPAFDECGLPSMEQGAAIGSAKFTVPADAVLVSKLNPRITRVWLPEVVSGEAICSTEFLVLVPKPSVTRTFLAVVCRGSSVSGFLEANATGTTKSHQRVQPTVAMQAETTVPLCKDEQNAIATILTDVDDEIAALEARLTKARDIKQGMMQQLLTGRIRLA